MESCIVVLTSTPADEHFDRTGVAVHVEIATDESGLQSADFWTAKTHAMQWMEEAVPSSIRVGPPRKLHPEIALAILNSVRSARIAPVVNGSFGYIHAVRYRLTIRSGFLNFDLSWLVELPPEWQELHVAVQALEKLGTDTETA